MKRIGKGGRKMKKSNQHLFHCDECGNEFTIPSTSYDGLYRRQPNENGIWTVICPRCGKPAYDTGLKK